MSAYPKNRKAPPEVVAEMIDLYAQGIGMKTIAKKLIGSETAKNTVRGILLRNGVTLRTVKETQDKATLDRRYAVIRLRNRASKRLKAPAVRPVELELWAPVEEKRRIDRSIELKEAANAAARDNGFKSAFQERYCTDHSFKALTIYKARFAKIAIGVGAGSKRMIEMIGCSPLELRRWIESQWEDWMTWDNLGNKKEGNWQIDHIVPCSWFNQCDEYDAAICWHHFNLRPLCSVENGARNNNPRKFGGDAWNALQSLPQSDIKDKLIDRAVAMGVRQYLVSA